MSKLARPIVRTGTARTKVILVRQAVKSVRRRDEPDPTMFRLTIGVIVAVGILAGVWLMGHLGFRLGFAPAVRLPELLGEPGEGLATGTLMLISVPRVILLAGVAEPAWLIVGFALIAIPAAAISAAKMPAPGGPRLSSAAVTFSYVGVIAAGMNAVALIWWAASQMRNDKIGELPIALGSAVQWLENLQTVAAFDVLVTIAAALWAVLVLRLAIPVWLKAIAASVSFFTLAVLAVAMSMSNAAVAQIEADRSLVFVGDGSLDEQLLLGFTRGHAALLRITPDNAVEMQLVERDAKLTVFGRQSLIDLLRDGPVAQQH